MIAHALTQMCLWRIVAGVRGWMSRSSLLTIRPGTLSGVFVCVCVCVNVCVCGLSGQEESVVEILL